MKTLLIIGLVVVGLVVLVAGGLFLWAVSIIRNEQPTDMWRDR